MKIGVFGNTNNTMFAMAQAMRSLGHETELIVTSKDLLNRPESHTPEFGAGYPDWIHDYSDLEETDYFTLSPGLDPVLKRLGNCDALILNYLGPSLLSKLDRPAVAFLTGSDLDYYANPTMVAARTQSWDPNFKASAEGQKHIRAMEELIQRQRLGIQSAVVVRYMARGLVPEGDRLLDELGVFDDRRIFLPGVEQAVKFRRPPNNRPIRVFCGARLTWKLPVELGRSSLDYKGSDIMVRGVGRFYRGTGTRLDIQLVRKGLHVKELEAVIAEEGLTDQVTWSDELSLMRVRERYANSDIVFDQLGDSIVGKVGFDAMATGRPVIANVQREMFEAQFGEAAPICQAKTPDEVAAQLNRLVFDAAERERVGRAGRQYVDKYLSMSRTSQILLQYLEEALRVTGRTARGAS
jgi:glycosyltransferase involved in cell wall biosynthesis